MAEDRNPASEDGVELGMLDEVSTSTTSIDLGATAQVSVILPAGYRDDDRDDDVIADELSAEEIARQELDTDHGRRAADSAEAEVVEVDAAEGETPEDLAEADVVDDSDVTEESDDDSDAADESDDASGDGSDDSDADADADLPDAGVPDAEDSNEEASAPTAAGDDEPDNDADAFEDDADEDASDEATIDESDAAGIEGDASDDLAPSAEALVAAADDVADADDDATENTASGTDSPEYDSANDESAEDQSAEDEASVAADESRGEDASDGDGGDEVIADNDQASSGDAPASEDIREGDPSDSEALSAEGEDTGVHDTEAEDVALAADDRDSAADDDASADFAEHIEELIAAKTSAISLDDVSENTDTAILREAAKSNEPLLVSDPAPVPAAVSQDTATRVEEAARTGRPSFIKSHARRVGDPEMPMREAAPAREESAVLTDDRLLETGAIRKPVPVDPWRRMIHSLTGGLINLGNGKATRERDAVMRRIAARIEGDARFIPVMSRKGGVGKTTVTALLGMALADARDDRVVAVDANPDRGTLAERIAKPSGKTVRDLVRDSEEIRGYGDMSAHVTRDETRLDVLASDADPHVADAFSDDDYRAVAQIAQHYYSLVLTDTGTGIVHSVMDATLDLADQLVIVSGVSIDEARLASETLTWLEANGREDLAQNAIVVINQEAAGKTHVRLDEVEAHFRSRVREVVRIPFDPAIATGSAISFHALAQSTRDAARTLAALVVEGIRA